MIRAFLAVELSQELRAEVALVQQELKGKTEPGMNRNRHISWVQPAKIHFTIKFLGHMDEQFLDPLLGVVEQAIGSQPSVNVPLERLGAFPVRTVRVCCGLARRSIGSGEQRRREW